MFVTYSDVSNHSLPVSLSSKNRALWTEGPVGLATLTNTHSLFPKTVSYLGCSAGAVCSLPISSWGVRKTLGWDLVCHTFSGFIKDILQWNWLFFFFLSFFLPWVCDGGEDSSMLEPLPRFTHQHWTHHFLCHISANIDTVEKANSASVVYGNSFDSAHPLEESTGLRFENRCLRWQCGAGLTATWNRLVSVGSAPFYLYISWPRRHCLRFFFFKESIISLSPVILFHVISWWVHKVWLIPPL